MFSAVRASTSFLTFYTLFVTATPAAVAQPAPSQLATQASVIVQGVILKPQSSDEPLLAPSPRTAVIAVRRMYAGSEFTGDLTGRTMTVILTRPLDAGQGKAFTFFGNPRYAGTSLTIADTAEIAASDLADDAIARGVQARRDAPLRARLAIAAAVFSGKVETVSPLKSEAAARAGYPPTEHDPLYALARVRVETASSGVKPGELVPVLFPTSRDIAWVNSPKLVVGLDAVFIAHRPSPADAAFLRGLDGMGGQPLVTDDANDVAPPRDERRVFELDRQRGQR